MPQREFVSGNRNVKGRLMRAGSIAILYGFVLLAARPTLALERWVVGNDQRPWRSVGRLVALDDTTEPGWLQPINVTGKNVAVGVEGRGGWITINWLSPRSSLPLAIDGKEATFFPTQFLDSPSGFDITIILDLGVPFGIDSLSFYAPKGYEEWFLRGYQFFLNPIDGKKGLSELRGERFGALSWYPIVRDWNVVAEDPIVLDKTVIGNGIPLQAARYVALSDHINISERRWAIAELEVWGVGYPLRATYTSDVIDLQKPVNFGTLYWSGMSDPESWVIIRSRVGRTPDPNIYHKRTGIGPEGQQRVSKTDYERLRPLERGTVDPDLKNWTSWSAPYLSGSEPMVSEGPSQYFQFEIQFQSRSPLDRTKIDSLAIEFSSSLIAQEIVGEISPTEVILGRVTTFTYAVKATFGPGDRGFDALRIFTPERATVKALTVDGIPVEPSVEEEDSGFAVRFPQHRVQKSGEIVEVTFASRVFVNGTRFIAEAFDTQTDEVPQRVVPGDASDTLETNDTLVQWPLTDESLLTAVDVSPEVLTPNGDGIHDVVTISYSFLQALYSVPVTVEVYDLSGSKIWHVRIPQTVGHYEVMWDGTRDDGERVPPGLYVYRVVVHAQKVDQQVGTIAVTY
ncbi:MAG: gliding motility-associated C-terminal domain-containing protein [Candidatus Latescibacteria bacterium]|nr:gliding motility-associated C-terminal domain-containing protein [Candidatus Latescibacterota bacterium]